MTLFEKARLKDRPSKKESCPNAQTVRETRKINKRFKKGKPI